MTIHLREIHLNNEDVNNGQYPMNVPVVQMLTTIAFTTPVTILVGENGSGKSTLMEALSL